jgi:gluconolactonase
MREVRRFEHLQGVLAQLDRPEKSLLTRSGVRRTMPAAIVGTGATYIPDHSREITVWDVVDDHLLRHGRTCATMVLDGVAGLADGIRADIDGNLWAAAGWGGEGFDGVHIFAPTGDRIGHILLPEMCSNLCFGGRKRNRLFITGSQSLYAVYIETQGAHIT